MAHLNLRGVDCRRQGVPTSRLRSRLVQALQARECLALVQRAEHAAEARRSSRARAREAGRAGDGRPPPRYDSVLRVRADLVPLQPIDLHSFARPAPGSRGGGGRVASGAPRSSGRLTSLFDCPPSSSAQLAAHDFALYGPRDAMGEVLGSLDGLTASGLAAHACDVGAVAKARLLQRGVLPRAGWCGLPRNGTSAVGSVRGSVADGCFFLDQEHPPNDEHPQPLLGRLYRGAADVATECLGLQERRDGRRPGAGPVCRPRGGWDGDWSETASPWDPGP